MTTTRLTLVELGASAPPPVGGILTKSSHTRSIALTVTGSIYLSSLVLRFRGRVFWVCPLLPFLYSDKPRFTMRCSFFGSTYFLCARCLYRWAWLSGSSCVVVATAHAQLGMTSRGYARCSSSCGVAGFHGYGAGGFSCTRTFYGWLQLARGARRSFYRLLQARLSRR